MKVEASCQINAPQEKVFQVFTDLESLPTNVTAITKIEILTPGEKGCNEIGKGTKFKETRVMFGKEADETMEITEFTPPSYLREEAWSGGMHYISEWSFKEIDGTTTVTINFSGKANSILGKIFSPLFFFMAGSMKKAFLTDMNELKAVIESEK